MAINEIDRGLMELAAKALGMMNTARIIRDIEGGTWNPLDNDGDAFVLAIKLGIVVDELNTGTKAGNMIAASMCHNTPDIFEPIGSDPAAAFRRAIVRVAAIIGMKYV